MNGLRTVGLLLFVTLLSGACSSEGATDAGTEGTGGIGGTDGGL